MTKKSGGIIDILIEKIAHVLDQKDNFSNSESYNFDTALSESISIIRDLCSESSWAKEILCTCTRIFKDANEILQSADSANFQSISTTLRRAGSLLLILGGYTEKIRVGGYIKQRDQKSVKNIIDDDFRKSYKHSKMMVVEVLQSESELPSYSEDQVAKCITSTNGIVRVKINKRRSRMLHDEDFKLPSIISLSTDEVLPVPEKIFRKHYTLSGAQ